MPIFILAFFLSITVLFTVVFHISGFVSLLVFCFATAIHKAYHSMAEGRVSHLILLPIQEDSLSSTDQFTELKEMRQILNYHDYIIQAFPEHIIFLFILHFWKGQ